LVNDLPLNISQFLFYYLIILIFVAYIFEDHNMPIGRL